VKKELPAVALFHQRLPASGLRRATAAIPAAVARKFPASKPTLIRSSIPRAIMRHKDCLFGELFMRLFGELFKGLNSNFNFPKIWL
jgi:hypothetical protein